MFCRNCGKQIDDQAVVCVGCGVPPKKAKKFCQNCGKDTNEAAEVCIACGVRLGGSGGTTLDDVIGRVAGEASSTGNALGIASIILGAITFGVQMMGGVCCGWLGWPLGLAGVITGAMAIKNGARNYGIAGIALSVGGVVFEILALSGLGHPLRYLVR